MKHTPENQCRRCGAQHEELFHVVDHNERWALATVTCTCGHSWTVIFTAPENLSSLRAWIARGCDPACGPQHSLKGGSWRRYRLEGLRLPAAV